MSSYIRVTGRRTVDPAIPEEIDFVCATPFHHLNVWIHSENQPLTNMTVNLRFAGIAGAGLGVVAATVNFVAAIAQPQALYTSALSVIFPPTLDSGPPSNNPFIGFRPYVQLVSVGAIETVVVEMVALRMAENTG